MRSAGDHVGVHAHADTEDNTGNAGQRQCGPREHAEVAGNDRQRCAYLAQKRKDRDRTRQAVAQDHQHRYQRKGDDARQDHHFQAPGRPTSG